MERQQSTKIQLLIVCTQAFSEQCTYYTFFPVFLSDCFYRSMSTEPNKKCGLMFYTYFLILFSSNTFVPFTKYWSTGIVREKPGLSPQTV